MNTEQIRLLFSKGAYRDILALASGISPENAEADSCFYIAKACKETGDLAQSLRWYAHLWQTLRDEEAAQELLTLYLDCAMEADAQRHLSEMEEEGLCGAAWMEGKYRLLLSGNATLNERIQALEELLDESFIKERSTELDSLYLESGQTEKSRRLRMKMRSVFGDLPAQEAPSQSKLPLPAPQAQNAAPALPVSVKNRFQRIVGLSQAQTVLGGFYATLQFHKERELSGIVGEQHELFHFVISGGAGSGKTMLANIAAELLRDFGVTESAQISVIPPDEFKKAASKGGADELIQLVRAAAPKIVLFDNIHLAVPETDPRAAQDIFDMLHKTVQECCGTHCLILTGSQQAVGKLFAAYPLLKGTFLYQMHIPPYSPDELGEIAGMIAQNKGFVFSPSAKAAMLELIKQLSRSPNFGGAKELQMLIDKAALNMARRIAFLDFPTRDQLMTLEPADFAQSFDKGETVEELLTQLNAMTGLKSVKEKVERMVAMSRLGTQAGTLHMSFKGNAGTGKTTVARIIGKIYQRLGLLRDGGKLIEVGRSDLVGRYQGETAIKVRGKIMEAMGGVLFIDEAYSLCMDDRDMFGNEAVNALVADIENYRNDLMVVFAGYSDDIDRFFDKNQGLSSRVPNEIIFEDYSTQELFEILRDMLSQKSIRITPDAEKIAVQTLERFSKQRDFGNARGVRNLADKLIEAQNMRLAAQAEKTGSIGDRTLLLKDDFTALTGQNASEKNLEYWMQKLHALTGLAQVKEQVQKKADALLVRREMEAMGHKPPGDMGTLHMVFMGNAGTGKTTVARIIAGIYNALEILPAGDIFVECGRSDLVAGYQGQTAIKVKEMVNRAMGGVLFIDEAYSLCRDENDAFGQEAVDALIAHMENHRDNLMVILAGYSDDMQRFFTRNQGLASRLSTHIVFEDYTIPQMQEILISILAQRELVLSKPAQALVADLLEQQSAQPNFGNARGVRNVADKIIENWNSRISALLKNGVKPEKEVFMTIEPEDLRL